MRRLPCSLRAMICQSEKPIYLYHPELWIRWVQYLRCFATCGRATSALHRARRRSHRAPCTGRGRGCSGVSLMSSPTALGGVPPCRCVMGPHRQWGCPAVHVAGYNTACSSPISEPLHFELGGRECVITHCVPALRSSRHTHLWALLETTSHATWSRGFCDILGFRNGQHRVRVA